MDASSIGLRWIYTTERKDVFKRETHLEGWPWWGGVRPFLE